MEGSESCRVPREAWPYEKTLLQSRVLRDVSHNNASSVWLRAQSGASTTNDLNVANAKLSANQSCECEANGSEEIQQKRKSLELIDWIAEVGSERVRLDDCMLVYRHMGDGELKCLLDSGKLPDDKPYQTIVREEEGRRYCEGYFNGKRFVDSNVTVIVEFCVPKALIEFCYAKQHKCEEGTLSHGLGNKAGRTLYLFNNALERGHIKFCTVMVKRRKKAKKK